MSMQPMRVFKGEKKFDPSRSEDFTLLRTCSAVSGIGGTWIQQPLFSSADSSSLKL